MRKQTKIAAIVSATALLAIGASMTSFAATGWQEENGTWVYYDRYESMVTNEWAKSGDNWFYLGDNGEMVRDALIESNDNVYYVDANGAMVKNRWVEVDNEETDDESAPTCWYYFQANGKAYKAPTNGNTSFKSINGKSYAFDATGKMLYGWVDGQSTRQTGETAWQNADYYLGDANDGARVTGAWRQVAVVDSGAEDPDQNYWFYFQANGKKVEGTGEKLKQKTINGKKYGFNEFGKMVYEWEVVATRNDANSTKVENYAYFSDPEDGAKKVKGWFKVVPSENINKEAADDDAEKWYYANGRGDLYRNAIKSVNGKKYLFNDKGEMVTGLVHLTFATGGSLTNIDALDYDKLEAKTKIGVRGITDNKTGIYYFVDNGDMQTGNQTVSKDGESFNFKFRTSGSNKGVGINGKDRDAYYVNGKKVQADPDLVYGIYKVNSSNNQIVEEAKAEILQKADIKKYKGLREGLPQTDKHEELEYIGSKTSFNAERGFDYVVINTNGSIIKSGTRKDGNEHRLHIKSGKLMGVYTVQ